MTTRRFTTADLENMLDDVPLRLLIGHSRKPMIERRKVIADYHRVRTELEQLREGYLDMARAELADGHDLSGQWHADVAFAIGRILNGDTDE